MNTDSNDIASSDELAPVPERAPQAPDAPEHPDAPVAIPPASEPSAEPVAPVMVGESPKRHSHTGVIAIAVVGSLLIGGTAGVAGGYAAYRTLPRTTAEVRQLEIIGDSTEEVVSAAAAVALPSVVNINVVGEKSSSPADLPAEHPDVPIEGEGSGVAYLESPDGGTYIITNNHVIEGATSIIVTDSTGEAHEARIVGADSESDIAVVLVETEIPTIALGDSDEVVVGQLAIAIGSPFGLQHSVTSGVISALHRPLTDFGGDDGEYPYIDSIQTDAAINPGNSGGALVDRTGALIGIPSAIYSDTGVSDGVGLAIPVSRAIQAADELIDKGRVDTPFLGILGQTVNAAFAAEENLPVQEGAYVVEVTAGTEAEKSGLGTGDIIVAVDDDRIRSMDDLILSVRRRAVGDEVTLTLWRDGEKTTVDMLVGVKPKNVTTGE